VSHEVTELDKSKESLRRDRMVLQAVHHAQTQIIPAEDPFAGVISTVAIDRPFIDITACEVP
jgi:hypothetical protein